ncbi:YjcZ family sporulation protein [Litchfieldia alkalitelluris]
MIQLTAQQGGVTMGNTGLTDGFALIVVLFILLIIVGAAWV